MEFSINQVQLTLVTVLPCFQSPICRTRFVGANWLAPLINFDHSLDISFFYYPTQTKGVLDDLRRKIAEMEATIASDMQAGRVLDPAISVALEDAHVLQEPLATGIERFFQFSFYI